MFDDLISEGYKLFSSRKLAPNFCSRCAPIRQDFCTIFENNKMTDLSSREMALYSSRSVTTMGGLGDYLHFLPRLLECSALSLFDPNSEWNTNESLLVKKVEEILEKDLFTASEREHIYKFFDIRFRIFLTDPDDYRLEHFLSYETSSWEFRARFLALWLSSTEPLAIEKLVNFVTNDVKIYYLKDPRYDEWFKSEPVLQKIISYI